MRERDRWGGNEENGEGRMEEREGRMERMHQRGRDRGFGWKEEERRKMKDLLGL
jgi:hypothetical protein